MPSEVRVSSDAAEDYRSLDGAVQRQVIKGLLKLQTAPEQRGRPLGSNATGNLTGFRRLVVGNRDHRIVYQVLEDGSLVVVLVIGERADDTCYQMALARLQLHGEEQIRALAVPLATLLDPR